MKTQIREFLKEEDGVTALEYGILAAIIVAAVALFAGYIAGLFSDNGWFHTQISSHIGSGSS